MSYQLDIDPLARVQIRALPAAAHGALFDAFEVLALVPERGEPLNADNPEGGLYQFVFGGGPGLITYLLLSDQRRVDVLIVNWVQL